MWTDTHAHTTRFDVSVSERVSERSTTYYWCINYRLTLYNVHTFSDAHERALTLALHSLESKNRTSAICNEIKQESVCVFPSLYECVLSCMYQNWMYSAMVLLKHFRRSGLLLACLLVSRVIIFKSCVFVAVLNLTWEIWIVSIFLIQSLAIFFSIQYAHEAS